MSEFINNLLYLAHLRHFKETIEPRTLSDWFNLIYLKAEVLNSKFSIQWGITQGQARPVLGIGVFPDFVVWCKTGECIFSSLGRVAKLVKTFQSNWKVHISNPTRHLTERGDSSTFLWDSQSILIQKLIVQTQWFTSSEWDCFLCNSHNFNMGQPNSI